MRMNDDDMYKKLRDKNLSHSPSRLGFDAQAYYDAGVIRKGDLVDGAYYQGICRNSYVAKWDAKDNCFRYRRYKFGGDFDEDINHIADDNGYDLFVPFVKLDDNDVEDGEKVI